MISFFGASVTQQRNGYVDYFSKLQKEKVSKFGYGGMHLNNAGICFIDEVAKRKPNICFLDWYSTSYQNQDGRAIEYLNTIVYKLNSINCRIISLFFPNNNEDNWSKFYEDMKYYHRLSGLEFISIDELLENSNKKELLRDTIHTTVEGSKLYADCIKKYLDKNSFYRPVLLNKTKYSDVQFLEIKRVFKDYLLLKGNCEIIGFYNKIGMYSGMVNLIADKQKENIVIWDRWCHYIRNHFNISFNLKDTAKIEILQDNIDTSQSTRSFNYSIYKKKMVLIGIYYVGNALEIENFINGSFFEYFLISIKELVFNIKHYIKSIIKKILRVKK